MRRCLGLAAGLTWSAALGCEVNPDFDPPDAATSSSMSGPAAVVVSGLRAAWGTPNQIRWEWEPQGTPDSLLGYELVVATTEDDVVTRSGSAVVWDTQMNPELGRYVLPNPASGDPQDPVMATVTDGHAEDQVHFAQLIATDTAGNTSNSNIATGRTTEAPIGELIVFSDDPPPGDCLPSTYVVSQSRPFAGDSHYLYESRCDGSGQCWEDLRFQGLGLDLSKVSQGSYSTTAFVEFALSVDGPATPWWCDMWLWYDGSSNEEIGHYSAWTARPTGQYYTIQIPLRDFRIGEAPVSHDVTQTYGLHGFNVGCPWADGATVLVDEVKIRW